MSSNLIDLNSPPPDPDYVNDKTFDENSNSTPPAITRDVFDMQPFSLTAEVQRSQLLTEQWFHAAISRSAAELLLKKDGDFLVRESQGKSGQYVLTGLQEHTPKHLLLIDPEGTVRLMSLNDICVVFSFQFGFQLISNFQLSFDLYTGANKRSHI